MAEPELFGINAGAGFAVVVSITLFSLNSVQGFSALAFLGAAVAAMAAMFSSFTQGLLVLDEALLDQVLFWLAGSVQGRKLETLITVLPYIGAGLIGSFIIAGKMNVLAMGKDVAKGLGLNTVLIKILIGILVILLAGGSVAVAGPIGIVGIVIPHITRSIIGIDHCWVIPFSGVLGAILLLIADITARYLLMPSEVPIGVMTAIIGTPFFIFIARRGFNGR